MVRCGGSERVWLTGRKGLVTHSASNEVGDQLLCSEIERGRQSGSKKGRNWWWCSKGGGATMLMW